MFKKLLLMILLLTVQLLYSKDIINFGISYPFIQTQSSETIFLNKQFPFELIFNNENELNQYNLIRLDEEVTEFKYLNFLKEFCINENFDYLILAYVYTNDNYIFFNIKLINPYSDIIILSKLFINKIDYTINEFLTDTVKKILIDINTLNLQSSEKFKIKTKEKELTFGKSNTKFKHEVFFLNGFFKNHSYSLSFLDLIIGYNFIPFDFFCVEGGLFFGIGNINNDFDITSKNLNCQYLGTFGSFYFFLPAIVEPRIGIRLEFSYIIKNYVYFSLPIDIGLKIYINEKNIIRIDSSFQFTSLQFKSIQKIGWERDFIIGVMIGYARKI